MPKLDDRNLLALLETLRREAVGHFRDEVATEQDENLRCYLGAPYGDEVEGRSQVVSQDSAQAVDWALPDLLEPFVSGEQVVTFEPNGPEDTDVARQATDYANFVFWKDNPGFVILHAAAKDGLIQKVGLTKVSWRHERRVETDKLTGLSLLAFNELEADAGIEVLDVRRTEIDVDALGDDAAAFPDGFAYDVDLRRTVDQGRVALEPVPPEEFKISPRSASLRDTPYCAHEAEKSLSDLVEMGFPRDAVEGLPPSLGADHDTSKDVRFDSEPRARGGTDAGDHMQRKVLLLEEYVTVDRDGDGESEILQVFRVEETILGIEEVDAHPFEAFTPYPLSHRFFGQALVDKIRQTQRVKTVLTRQMLDNVYLANNPQREVPEDAVTDDGATYDDLLTFRVGGLVRTKKPGLLRELGIPDRSGTALAALEHFDRVREQETGVVQGAIGLSSETIDKRTPVTAEEARRRDRGQQKRVRLMARIFAETYLVPLFAKVLALIVKYQDFERIVRLRGQWVTMDPRHWNARMDATISVGLGHPNREDQLSAALAVLALQREALALGLAGPEHLFNTARRIVEAAGFRSVSEFFIDPAEAKLAPPPPQPDPRLLELGQRAELRLLELQQQQQLEMLKLRANTEVEMAKIEAKLATDRDKAEADLTGKLGRIDGELALAEQRLVADIELKRQELLLEAGLKAEALAQCAGTAAPALRLDGGIG